MAKKGSYRCYQASTPRKATPVDPTSVITVLLGVRLALLGSLGLRLWAGVRRHRDQLHAVALLATRLPAGMMLEADLSSAASGRLRIRVQSPGPGER
jgi:hypothetical protein